MKRERLTAPLVLTLVMTYFAGGTLFAADFSDLIQVIFTVLFFIGMMTSLYWLIQRIQNELELHGR